MGFRVGETDSDSEVYVGHVINYIALIFFISVWTIQKKNILLSQRISDKYGRLMIPATKIFAI